MGDTAADVQNPNISARRTITSTSRSSSRLGRQGPEGAGQPDGRSADRQRDWDAKTQLIAQLTPTVPIPLPWYTNRRSHCAASTRARARCPFRPGSSGRRATVDARARSSRSRDPQYLRGDGTLEVQRTTSSANAGPECSATSSTHRRIDRSPGQRTGRISMANDPGYTASRGRSGRASGTRLRRGKRRHAARVRRAATRPGRSSRATSRGAAGKQRQGRTRRPHLSGGRLAVLRAPLTT